MSQSKSPNDLHNELELLRIRSMAAQQSGAQAPQRRDSGTARRDRTSVATRLQAQTLAYEYQDSKVQRPDQHAQSWRPLLLVLRTLLAIGVAYVVVITIGASLRSLHATLADIGLALLIGLAFGVLCPEHWVWAAPLPTCIALTQVWGTAHAAAVGSGGESLEGLVIAYIAYLTLALLPAWIARIVLDRRSARGIPSVGNVS